MIPQLSQLNRILATLEAHLRQSPAFSIGVSAVDAALADYQAELSRLAEKARKGDIEQRDFEQQAEAIVTAALLALFNLGRQSDEPDYEAQAAFEQERVMAFLAIGNLSRDIFTGRYVEQKEGDKVTQSEADGRARLEARIVLWAATGAGVYALGQLHREASIKYAWRIGRTSKHCVDCLRLAGQIHTALEWRLSGWRPQFSGLSCGGWNCDCSLIETDGDVTGGF